MVNGTSADARAFTSYQNMARTNAASGPLASACRLALGRRGGQDLVAPANTLLVGQWIDGPRTSGVEQGQWSYADDRRHLPVRPDQVDARLRMAFLPAVELPLQQGTGDPTHRPHHPACE